MTAVTAAGTRTTTQASALGTRLVPWTLTVAGLAGLACALILTIEKLALARDPDYLPSCSINPLLSCGSVMNSPQAEAFGFPNSLLGIVGFSVVVTTGVGMLLGASFPRRYLLGLLAGSLVGVIFVHWLIYQSLYRIGALCPYCMVVWVATIAIFWYVAQCVLERHTGSLPRWCRTAGERTRTYHAVILLAWLCLIALAIVQAFWDYWAVSLW